MSNIGQQMIGLAAPDNVGVEGGLHLIEELDLTSDTSFTVPDGYEDLVLVVVARTNTAAVGEELGVRINGDSAANYVRNRLLQNGGGVTGQEALADTEMRLMAVPAASSPAGSFGVMRAVLPGYGSTSIHKVMVGQSAEAQTYSSSQVYSRTGSSWWKNTAAITSLQIVPVSGGAFVAGSKARLYGVKARNGQVNVSFTGAKATKSAGQSVPNTTVTEVTWDGTDFDSDGFFSDAGDSFIVPAGQGGKYRISTTGDWANNGSGRRSLDLKVNGTSVAGYTTDSDTNRDAFSFGVSVELVPGDEVTLDVWQNSGGAINIGDGVDRPTTMEIVRLGQAVPSDEAYRSVGVQESLTDLTTYTQATYHTWGTATIAEADLPPGRLRVEAHLTGSQLGAGAGQGFRYMVDISFDGGSTWQSGVERTQKLDVGGANTESSIAARELRNGTPTGDVMARARIYNPWAANAPDAKAGRLQLVVTQIDA